jgi:type VI secretion system protein ImpL
MKGMIDFISNKWVIQFFGLFAVALLLWFAGPWIGIRDGYVPLESVGARLLAITALLLLWGIWHLVRLAWAGYKDRALFNRIVAEDSGKISIQQKATENVEVLRKGFENSVKLLQERRAKEKGSQQCLYELPWYIIIGIPGTGKTTALINSGLKFPLAARADKNPLPVKGVSGTRNCDWWFTTEAVFFGYRRALCHSG